MRDRRWRRLVDSDRDRQRTAAAAASGGVRGWLRKHIVIRIISIIGVPLVGVITVWFSGFFDSIFQNVVPSGADTFCVLHEAIENYWPFATQPAPLDRFTILIARIDHDDADHTYTRAVAPHFWPGFINLQHFCHSRWQNPVRLSKSGQRRTIWNLGQRTTLWRAVW